MDDGRLLSRVHDGSGVFDLRGVELLAGASSVTFLRGPTVPRAGSDQERSQQNFHLEEMFGNCEAYRHKTHSHVQVQASTRASTRAYTHIRQNIEKEK